MRGKPQRWLIAVTATATIAASMVALPALSAQASTQTLVLQNGNTGYQGTTDTWVSSADWDTPVQYSVNYGINKDLTLSRDGNDNPLLRFDLTKIPSNSTVSSAKLSLYNTTDGTCDTKGSKVRYTDVYEVLRPWDGGNQIASPINAVGKHGATGDKSFDYAPGQGTDILWGSRGMQAGKDYANTRIATAPVLNAGWYQWDVTSLIRSQVRGERPNYGMTLRDATGYEDNNCDWRNFVSSNNTEHLTWRPMLTVTYNPDVPFASAGPDQTNMQWNGTPITLNASTSRDRPGGNNSTLRYAWRVVTAGYGSQLYNTVVSTSPTGSFTPDVPGQWTLELTVTNSLNQSATDTVNIRVLKIPTAHPRIFVTQTSLPTLRARTTIVPQTWQAVVEQAQDSDGMSAKALVSLVSKQPALCTQAINSAMTMTKDEADWSTKAGDIAVIYDWCHGQLTPFQIQQFVTYFNTWCDHNRNAAPPGWGNYWPRYSSSLLMIGLATLGENPRAKEWLDEYRITRYQNLDLPALKKVETGGSWPEGTVYDGVANYDRIKAVEAWRVATGENLYLTTSWFANRAGYFLLSHQPGVADNWGHYYHPYTSIGDAERNRGAMMNYERIMALILINRYPNSDTSKQLQGYLSAPPANSSWSFLVHEEFLWNNPSQPKVTPTRLVNYSPGQGQLFIRSGWANGASDVNGQTLATNPTYITFQSGDHYSYHQHYDQNSFTLFKGADLAVESGVYSGDGLSDHDINYYVRTIAHNTLVVYNPAEDFSSARPDATSNDGGQRTMYPGSRAPETVEDWNRGSASYDTADTTRIADNPLYTYALGDATKAYNNPVYNQANAGVGLPNNTAKVSQFKREFVYLRPVPGQTNSGDYVIILDRVGVTKPAYSGANTKLLFHTLNRPTVSGGTVTNVSPGETLVAGGTSAVTTVGKGRLFFKVLQPSKANLRVVGGQGQKSFWAFGKNYDWHWASNEPQPRPISDFEDAPYGQWRIELEPADTALQHTFLTVLQPTLATTKTMTPTVSLAATANVRGALIKDPTLARIAIFSNNTTGQTPVGTIEYDYPISTPNTLNLIFDLTPGATYTMTMTKPTATTRHVVLTPNPLGTLRANNAGIIQFNTIS